MCFSGFGFFLEQFFLFCCECDNQFLILVVFIVLLFRRENVLYYLLFVIELIVVFVLYFDVFQLCFLVVFYSDFLFKQFGGFFFVIFDFVVYFVDLLRYVFYFNFELEQVCVVILWKEKVIVLVGKILSEFLFIKELQEGLNFSCGFEFLGFKFFILLFMQYVKEFMLCKIGDIMWKKSFKILIFSFVLVLVFRGVNVFVWLRCFLDFYLDLLK